MPSEVIRTSDGPARSGAVASCWPRSTSASWPSATVRTIPERAPSGDSGGTVDSTVAVPSVRSSRLRIVSAGTTTDIVSGRSATSGELTSAVPVAADGQTIVVVCCTTGRKGTATASTNARRPSRPAQRRRRRSRSVSTGAGAATVASEVSTERR